MPLHLLFSPLDISPPPKLYNASRQFKWHCLGENILGPSGRKGYSLPWAPSAQCSIVMLIALHSNSLFPSLPPLLDSSNVYLLWCFPGRVKGAGVV